MLIKGGDYLEPILTNPFLEDIEAIEEEIRIRKARDSLLEYEMIVNPNYIPSKFHTFLCNKIQEFLETETGHAIDVLLLSVP